MNNDILKEAHKKRNKIIQSVLDWSKDNIRTYPWRENRTPYSILLAEFLLRRTTASAVKRIYQGFLNKYSSLRIIDEVKQKELESDLKTIGYHKLRSRMLKQTASHIINNFDGVIPCTKEELLSVPNIGYYAAGAILSLGYGKTTPMVDSNVERILRRVFKNSLTERAIGRQLSKIAKILIPNEECDIFNLALIDIGSLICTYRKTDCHRCPISGSCDMCEHYPE